MGRIPSYLCCATRGFSELTYCHNWVRRDLDWISIIVVMQCIISETKSRQILVANWGWLINTVNVQAPVQMVKFLITWSGTTWDIPQVTKNSCHHQLLKLSKKPIVWLVYFGFGKLLSISGNIASYDICYLI